MLKNFLKNDLDSNDPTTRIIGIQNLDPTDPEHQSRLINLARSDSDDSVKMAALTLVTDPAVLTEIAWGSAAPLKGMNHSSIAGQVVLSARSRMETLLDSPDAISEVELKKLLQSNHTGVFVQVANHASDESIREAAIARLEDENDIAEVVNSSRFHSSREMAASRLESESIIQACANHCRTRDKVVSRQLQQRLDCAREVVREKTARAEEIKLVHKAVDKLAGSVWSPDYPGRFTALTERWDQISPIPSDEEKEKFLESQCICVELIEKHKNQQQTLEYCVEADNQLNEIKLALKKMSLAGLENSLGEIKKNFVDATGMWRISSAAARPARELENTFNLQREDVQKLIKDSDALLRIHQTLPSTDAAKGKELEDILGSLERSVVGFSQNASQNVSAETEDYQFYIDAKNLQSSLESQLKQQRNIADDRFKAVQKQLGILGASIKNGKWSASNSLYIRVEKKVKQLSDHKSHKALVDQQLKHKAKLDELADWQDFAAKPKLELLCTKMEQLGQETLSPVAKGEKLKALQAQWKEIGPSRIASSLWDRFKLAGDKAYEPVAEFQKIKRSERDGKLKNKKKICTELKLYLETINWTEADWKTVEKTLRMAKSEWRRNRVTDRKPNKALEDKFTVIVNAFNEKLNEQYDRNASFKEDLIEKVAKISDAEVNQHAINQTKRLQNTWKQSGIMRRKQDQELWEKFNGHCREIYKQHGSAQRQKTESGLTHVREARDIVRSIKTLCKSHDPDEKKFQSLQEKFNALAEFPEKDKKGLLKDFNRSCEQFSRMLEKTSDNAAKAEYRELVRKSLLCEQYESMVGSKAADDDLQNLHAEWESTELVLPKKWSGGIEGRRSIALEHIKSGTGYDYSDGEQQRRMTCIQAEILVGAETPPEDKAMRMSYQLEHLQHGLGASNLTDVGEALHALALEWLMMPPAQSTIKDKLASRIANCLESKGIELT